MNAMTSFVQHHCRLHCHVNSYRQGLQPRCYCTISSNPMVAVGQQLGPVSLKLANHQMILGTLETLLSVNYNAPATHLSPAATTQP